MPPFVAQGGYVIIDPLRVSHTRVGCSVPGCPWPGVSLGDRGCAETVLALHLVRSHGAFACQLLDPVIEFELPDAHARQPHVEQHWS